MDFTLHIEDAVLEGLGDERLDAVLIEEVRDLLEDVYRVRLAKKPVGDPVKFIARRLARRLCERL